MIDGVKRQPTVPGDFLYDSSAVFVDLSASGRGPRKASKRHTGGRVDATWNSFEEFTTRLFLISSSPAKLPLVQRLSLVPAHPDRSTEVFHLDFANDSRLPVSDTHGDVFSARQGFISLSSTRTLFKRCRSADHSSCLAVCL
ncbi:hypothetical protein RRG08_030340 [Elysia crispata]|uniref:Uncharacterized protein n=1 Tax=Elysia crispata TaxID=231223 RepID=A0AAE0YJH5_9GAST|nr:hypothetical protein RRG08_030340 [Elysia crispata]